jgi:hypothetical protein
MAAGSLPELKLDGLVEGVALSAIVQGNKVKCSHSRRSFEDFPLPPLRRNACDAMRPTFPSSLSATTSRICLSPVGKVKTFAMTRGYRFTGFTLLPC